MKQEYTTNEEDKTIIIIRDEKQSNGLGTAGFVLSLVALIFSWIPGVGWIVWFLGFLLSFIGMFKSPRGLAIAGFIISLIDLIILIVIISAISSILPYFTGNSAFGI